MNLKITKKEEKPALSYTRIEAELVFEQKTPSRKELTAEIAKKAGVKEELVSIMKINPVYGYRNSKVEAIFYHDEKAKKELEPEWIRNRLEGKKNAAGEKAAEKKPEGK